MRNEIGLLPGPKNESNLRSKFRDVFRGNIRTRYNVETNLCGNSERRNRKALVNSGSNPRDVILQVSLETIGFFNENSLVSRRLYNL